MKSKRPRGRPSNPPRPNTLPTRTCRSTWKTAAPTKSHVWDPPKRVARGHSTLRTSFLQVSLRPRRSASLLPFRVLLKP